MNLKNERMFNLIIEVVRESKAYKAIYGHTRLWLRCILFSKLPSRWQNENNEQAYLHKDEIIF